MVETWVGILCPTSGRGILVEKDARTGWKRIKLDVELRLQVADVRDGMCM